MNKQKDINEMAYKDFMEMKTKETKLHQKWKKTEISYLKDNMEKAVSEGYQQGKTSTINEEICFLNYLLEYPELLREKASQRVEELKSQINKIR